MIFTSERRVKTRSKREHGSVLGVLDCVLTRAKSVLISNIVFSFNSLAGLWTFVFWQHGHSSVSVSLCSGLLRYFSITWSRPVFRLSNCIPSSNAESKNVNSKNITYFHLGPSLSSPFLVTSYVPTPGTCTGLAFKGS